MLLEIFTGCAIDSGGLGRTVLNRSVKEMLQIKLGIENGGLCHDRVKTMYK